MNLLKNRPKGMHTLSLKRQTTRFKSGCFLLGPYSKSIDTLLEVHYTQTRYGGINMKKILVIEDDQITREGIVAFLTHHQYHVLSAVDGHSARNTFDQHDFDLVILDIMIPHEDGLQLLQYFKNTKDVAVMMVTALGDDKTQTTSYDYLADDYVIKPFSLMILEKKVAAILRRYENRVKNIWNYGQAEVHFDTFTAYYNHEVVDLKVKEIQNDFATLNGLKLHDIITIPESKDRNQNIIKSQKLEIIGIFKGSNKDRANHFSELFENVMLSDLNTAATLRGMEHKPLYESATFYVNNPKKIESIISDVKNMDLDWVRYVVHKADQTFMGLTSSLDNMDGIINKLVTGSIIMSILMLSVVLWLWIGTRVHETGILLSMGMSKLNILSQFVLEVLIIAILSFSLSFMTTDKIARNIGSSIIKQAQTQTIRQQNQELNGMAFGSDANTSVTTKTVDSIDVSITHSELIKVAIIGSVIIIISVLGASNYIIRLKPKEILSQMS